MKYRYKGCGHATPLRAHLHAILLENEANTIGTLRTNNEAMI